MDLFSLSPSLSGSKTFFLNRLGYPWPYRVSVGYLCVCSVQQRNCSSLNASNFIVKRNADDRYMNAEIELVVAH